MPIYEFLCPKCQTKSSILVKSITESFTPRCPTCGSNDLVRVITSFAHHKSIKTVWEESGESQRFPGSDYYKDPRNVGRWTEKRFKELGMDMPNQIQEQIQAAREGELPDSVKEKL
jgi:putative FmdB family regulatory protein